MKRVSKALLAAAAAVLCLWTASAGAAAADMLPVLEQKVTERGDAVVLYVPYKGEAGSVQVKIGQTDVTAKVGDENPEVITWMLYDNSLSIAYADREKAKSVFTDYFGRKIPSERINLCTFEEKLNRLTVDSDDTIDLPNKMQGVEHADQETYLTDVLDELLDIEEGRKGTQFVRVLVFSDGVDNNPRGITREELLDRLKERNIPIYTIGCGTDDAALKSMYSISRQTGGKNWELADLDSTAFATAFRYDEAPAVIRVSIPADLRDGSVRAVQLTLPDGSQAEVQVRMPHASAPVPPVPDPDPDPVPHEEPVPAPAADDDGPGVLMIVMTAALALLLIAGAALGIILLVRNRAEKNRVVAVQNGGGMDWGPANDAGRATDIMDSADDGYNVGATAILVGDDRFRMLSLSDLDHPEHHFEVPMRDRVSIGRGPSNMVVLDYDRSVSGTHCEIYSDGDSYRIRDLDSSNGTYVDGMRVADSAEVPNGCTIRLGRVNFRVNIR